MSPALRPLLFAVPIALLTVAPAHAESTLASQSSTSPISVNTTTGQADGGRTDIVRVRVGGVSKGSRAVTTLYKRVDERNVRITSKRLSSAGSAEFRVRDLNERRYTQYFVRVAQTEDSFAKSGPIKRVR